MLFFHSFLVEGKIFPVQDYFLEDILDTLVLL